MLDPAFSVQSMLLWGGFAWLVSSLTIIVLWLPAKKLGFVDHPDLVRKTHQKAALLIGGIAVFSGFGSAMLYFSPTVESQLWVISGAGLMLLVGVFDDRFDLSPTVRFIAQIGAALLMIYLGKVSLIDLGQLLGDKTLYLGWASIPVTVFCAVGVMNTMNMIDGMDGLAGSVSIVCMSLIAVMAWIQQDLAWLTFSLGLMGALSGFLIFNIRFPGRRNALVFLGDGGSLVLGFLMAWVMISGSQYPQRLFPPVCALWLLAVPLMDTVFVMLERIRAGKSPFSAGTDHLHHLFLRSGYSVNATLLCYLTTCAVLGGASLLMLYLGVSQVVMFALFLALCGLYNWRVLKAWKLKHWLGRHFD